MRRIMMFAAVWTLIVAGHAVAAGPSTEPGEAGAQTRPASQPAGGEAASAEVLSVQVNRAIAPELARAVANLRRFGSNGVYNQQSGDRSGGVDLLFAVHLPPDRAIISAGEDALEIDNFIDDKYVELGHGKRAAGNGFKPPTVNVAENQHACVFSVSSDRAPSSEATRLLMRGTVAFRTGRGEKTSERQKLGLHLGKKIDVGPVPFTLESIADSVKGVRLGFFAEASIERVRAIQFFGADGKEIDAHMEFRNEGGQLNVHSTNLSYALPNMLDEVEVQVNYWEEIESIRLPIEVQADIGVATTGKPTTMPVATKPARGARSAVTPGPVRIAERTQAARLAAKDHGADETSPSTAPVAIAWPARERAPFPTSRPAELAFPATRPAFPPPPPTALAGAPATQEGPATGRLAATTHPAVLAGSKVELMSLSVSKMPPKPLADTWGYRPEFVFRDQGGTVLRVLASAPDCTVISLDPHDVLIDRFADDTGTERSVGLMPENLPGAIVPFAPFGALLVSADGHHALFRVALEDVPSPAATRLAVSGSAAVRVGVDLQASEAKDVRIAVGSVIDAGAIRLTVTSLSSGMSLPAGAVPLNDYPVTVTLSSPADPELIHKIEVFDADGHRVPCNMSRPSVQPDGRPRPSSYVFTCTLSRDVEKATVKVTFFDRIESARLPFHIVAGVGLTP